MNVDLNTDRHLTPNDDRGHDMDIPTNSRLTHDEREILRQEALERFFPGVNFVSGSPDGGLKLAHGGALAVAICTGRMSRSHFYFGPRITHFKQVALAELAYLVLCGVVCDAQMVEQERVFFAIPMRVIGDEVFVKGHPLASVSIGGHYNVTLDKRADEWVLSFGGGFVLPLADCDRPIGTVFVGAHLRGVPSPSTLPPNMLALQQLLRDLAACELDDGYTIHIHPPGDRE